MFNMFKIYIIFIALFTFSSRENQFGAADPLFGDVTPAKPGEFLFVVSIIKKKLISEEDPYGHVCGGGLITSNFVLTAAHCYLEAGETLDDYQVCAESTDLDNCRKVGLQAWETYQQWSVRTKTKSEFFENDISIIQLKEHVNVPVAILSKKSPKRWIGKDVIIASWMVFDHVTSREMRKADLRILSPEECINNIKKALVKGGRCSMHLEKNIICTNHTPYVALHNGDSGSPIFVKTDNDVYKIVAVNSKSRPNQGFLHRSKEQNLHVSVHYYKKFITNLTGLKL